MYKNIKWVSINDSLPDLECLVINKWNEAIIGSVTVDTERGGYKAWNDNEELIFVTHWVYINPPEQ